MIQSSLVSPKVSLTQSLSSRNVLSDDQCTQLFKKFFEKLSADDKTEILNNSVGASKPLPILMDYTVKVATGPNIIFPHPVSKIDYPIIYTILSTQPQKRANRHLLLNRTTDIFYNTFFNTIPIAICLLHSAILQNKIEVAYKILDSALFPKSQINESFCPVNAKGITGRAETALSLAARKHQPQLIIRLLNRGAKIYAQNADGEDCLTKATKLGTSHETLKLFFSKSEVKDKIVHQSLLHTVIQNAYMKPQEMVRSIDVLLAHGNHLDAHNVAGHTPLYESFLKPALKQVSSHLLELGADNLVLYDKNGSLLANAKPLIQEQSEKISSLLETADLLPSVLNSIVNTFLLGEEINRSKKDL